MYEKFADIYKWICLGLKNYNVKCMAPIII